MFDPKNIIILLAAYNGEKYLSEQIRSIQGQTISNWTLLVRDDGSQDNTRDLLEKFAVADNRIRIVHDQLGCLGAARNFGALMQAALAEGANRIFLSDQDDIWVPDKILRQLRSLEELETQYGSRTPLLSYSDLEVVDENLRSIYPSFMRYQMQRHEPDNPIFVLLAQNLVAGCSVAINRPLLEIAVPIPDEIFLHDWWLAVCAAACGRIGYIDESLVRYRQHSANRIGAITVPSVLTLFTAAYRKRLSETPKYMLGPTRQAAILSERIKIRKLDCSSDVDDLLKSFASCLEKGLFQRLWTVYRLPLRRQGLWRKLLWFLRLLLMRKPPRVKRTFSANRSIKVSSK